MTQAQTSKLTGIAGGPATVWDVGTMLERAVKEIKKLDSAILAHLSETEEYQLGELKSAVTALVAKINDVAQGLEGQLQREFDRSEVAFESLHKQRDSLAKRIEALPAMPELPRLEHPGYYNDIIDIVERLEKMTPQQWGRFKDFAAAMRQQG